MLRDREAANGGLGAAGLQRTAPAMGRELGNAALRELGDMSRRAGNEPLLVIDDEVVANEAAGDDRSRGQRLDDEAVVVLFQFGSGRSRSIGRVREHLET